MWLLLEYAFTGCCDSIKGPTTWLYSVMYRSSLMLMNLTRPSLSSFLMSSMTRFSWWLSVCIAQRAHTSSLPHMWSHVRADASHGGVDYLSKEGDSVWGQLVVSPHLLHRANGYWNWGHTFCSCNKFLITLTLLSLKPRGEVRLCCCLSY